MSANGNARLLNWFMGISTALLVAAVAGLWSMSREVSSMSSTMKSWTRTFEDTQDRIRTIEDIHRTGAHEGADRRLQRLEKFHYERD